MITVNGKEVFLLEQNCTGMWGVPFKKHSSRSPNTHVGGLRVSTHEIEGVLFIQHSNDSDVREYSASSEEKFRADLEFITRGLCELPTSEFRAHIANVGVAS